jgi:hypothetical protein
MYTDGDTTVSDSGVILPIASRLEPAGEIVALFASVSAPPDSVPTVLAVPASESATAVRAEPTSSSSLRTT